MSMYAHSESTSMSFAHLPSKAAKQRRKRIAKLNKIRKSKMDQVMNYEPEPVFERYETTPQSGVEGFGDIIKQRFYDAVIENQGLVTVDVDLTPETKSTIDNVVDKMSEVLGNHNINIGLKDTTIDCILDLAAVAGLVIGAYKRDYMILTVSSIFALVRFPSLAKHVRELMGWFTRKFDIEQTNEIEMQSGISKGAPLAIAGSLFLWKMLDSIGYCSDFSDVVAFSSKSLGETFGGNFIRGLDGLLNFIQMIVDKVCNMAFGKDAPFSFVSRRGVEARKIILELMDLDVARGTNSIALKELEFKLEANLEQLSLCLKEVPRDSSIFSIGTQTVTKFNNILREVKVACRTGKGNRIEPVCYMFIGPPGCGKSMFNTAISNYFVKNLSSDYMRKHYEEDPDMMQKNVYVYNDLDQYWSAYMGQLVCLIDEASPQPTTTGSVATPAQIIKMVNSTQYPCNMADLGSKGNTYFDSRVILGTSNCRNWRDLPGVADPVAFYRRVKFVVTEPNVNALKAHFGEIGDCEFETYRPQMKDFMEDVANRYTDGEMSFEDYLDQCYKFVEFRLCSQLTKEKQLHEVPYVVMQPSKLIEKIVKDSNKNELQANFRTKLARAMLRPGNDNIVKQVGGQVPGSFDFMSIPSKIKQVVKDRYFAPTTTRTHDFDKLSRYNYLKKNCVGLSGCADDGCTLCQMYMHYDSMFEFACAAFTKVKGSSVNNCEKDSLHHEYLKGHHDLVFKKGVKPCELPTDVDDAYYFIMLMNYHDTSFREKLSEDWKDANNGIVPIDKRSTFWKISFDVGVITTLVLGVKLMLIAVNTFSGNIFSSPKDQSDYPLKSVKQSKKSNVKTLRKADLNKLAKVGDQGGADDLYTSISRNNVYRFTIQGRTCSAITSHFTMVQNQLAILPKHVIESVINCYKECGDAKMIISGSIQRKGESYSVKKQEIPLCNLVNDEDGAYNWIGTVMDFMDPFVNEETGEVIHSDLVLVHIPVTGKTITKHLFDKTFFDSKSESFERDGVLCTIDDDFLISKHHGRVSKQDDWKRISSISKVYDEETGLMVEEPHYYGARMFNIVEATKRGYCGAPLFIKQRGIWRLAGIHVAGVEGGNNGFSVHVSKQDVEDAIEMYYTYNRRNNTKYVILKEDDADAISAQGGFVSSENYEGAYGHQVLGTVKRPVLAIKTALRKSPIYHLIDGPAKAPALLKPTVIKGKLVNPMEKAQDGYGNVSIAPRNYAVSAIVENTWASIARFPIREHDRQTPEDWRTVVVPGVNFEHCKSMPRNTSPGYPYCLSTKKQGKKDFFGDNQHYEFESEACKSLFKDATETEQRILRGERPLLVCMSFLKDERRPIAKVLAGKTRLVSSSNVLLTLLIRKYTMGFTNWTIRNKIQNGICVGVNPYSGDWTDLAQYHEYKAKGHEQAKSIAGDFSGYDKTLHYEWIMAFADLMDCFYDDRGSENCYIRRALIREIAFSRHVVEDMIVEWVGSNTSGNPLTTLINSYCNIFMIKHAISEMWLSHNALKITSLSFMIALDENFNAECPKFKISVFGDDNLITCVSLVDCKDWFTPAKITEAFLEGLGITYTDENKGEVMIENLRHIRDCTFLKRGFAEQNDNPVMAGRFGSPLELDTILDSIRWKKHNPDGDDMTDWASNVSLMLEELSQHKKSIYNAIGTQIIQACKQVENGPRNMPRVLENQIKMQVRLATRELIY